MYYMSGERNAVIFEGKTIRPQDPEWQAYLDWVAQGNEAGPSVGNPGLPVAPDYGYGTF
jgi:hypothetical protein